jgi:hypothetical protein
LIELTGAKVCFEAAVRDQVVCERRQGEGGRNPGGAQSKSMIQDEVPPLEMRRSRRIATWLTTRTKGQSQPVGCKPVKKTSRCHIRPKRFQKWLNLRDAL